MITNEVLLRLMIRAYSHMRREPSPSSDDGLMTLKTKGFGIVLDILSNNDGISPAQIAEIASMRQQSISETLIKLEERGYIRRETCEDDKRKTLIYITDEGKITQKDLKARREQMADSFFSCLTEDERRSLYDVLVKLCKFND